MPNHLPAMGGHAAPLLNMARNTWRGILRLIYPPTCLGCDAVQETESALLCEACRSGLRHVDPDRISAELGRLPAGPGVIDRAFSLWVLEPGGAVQKVHRELKYGNRPVYGVRLGMEIGHGLRGGYLPLPFHAVIPVPLHRVRLYERGYNQSAALAEGISRVLGIPLREDMLIRSRPTRSQTSLSRPERWDNVDGAFEVRTPEAVRGRRLLLVDDLFTTGATLLAAATALRAAGAAHITAATLGYAQS